VPDFRSVSAGSKRPELLIDAAEREVEAGLRLGLAVERARLLDAAVEEADDAQVLRRAGLLVAPWKRSSMNCWMRSVRAACATASLRAIARRTVIEGDEPTTAASDGRADPRARRWRRDELAQPVADALGARLERLAPQVVVDVADERLDRAVAPRGSLCIAVRHRTSSSAHARFPAATPGAGAFAATAEALRLPLDDDRLRLGRRAAATGRTAAAREQLVEDDAERVDVGLDAERLAAHLLGRGVGRGHEAQAGARLVGGPLEALERLRDPEVRAGGSSRPSFTRMLDGFRSRWMTACACACARPRTPRGRGAAARGSTRRGARSTP
jgi:hypothetical protein